MCWHDKGARAPKYEESMGREFQQILDRHNLRIDRRPAGSREEIITGVLLSCLLGSSGVARSAIAVGLLNASARSMQKRSPYGSVRVLDAYAPPRPIDLVIMAESAGERFGICVEVKRFNTNSNWIHQDYWPTELAWPRSGRPRCSCCNDPCEGLWQTDVASFTPKGTGWRELADDGGFPIRHYIVLAPTSRKKRLAQDFFPGMHSAWAVADYNAFVDEMIGCAAPKGIAPLRPLLSLLMPPS
ncbi:hypothetical protein [Geodermatophilus sp. SYSU D00815]